MAGASGRIGCADDVVTSSGFLTVEPFSTSVYTFDASEGVAVCASLASRQARTRATASRLGRLLGFC